MPFFVERYEINFDLVLYRINLLRMNTSVLVEWIIKAVASEAMNSSILDVMGTFPGWPKYGGFCIRMKATVFPSEMVFQIVQKKIKK